MRLRHPVSVAATVAVLSGLLSVPPSPVAIVSPAAASSVADPETDTSEDVPEVDPVPLDHLPLPTDPADAIVTLPNGAAELPPDDTASVELEEGWTDVPGLPVEVAEAEAPVEPFDEPDPETDPLPIDPPAEQPEAGDEVTVELMSPENQHQGVVLLQVDSSEPPAAEQPTAPEPTDNPSTDPPATETPTADPSATPASEPTEPTPSTEPSAEPSQTPTTPTTPSDPVPTEPSAEDPVPGDSDPAPTTTDEQADPVVDIRLSYEDYASVFGGGWADRVVVTAYPACFVDTPRDPACSTGVPVEAINDSVTQTLTFTTLGEEAPTSPAPDDGADGGANGDDESQDPADPADLADPSDPTLPAQPGEETPPSEVPTEVPSEDPSSSSVPSGVSPRVAPAWALKGRARLASSVAAAVAAVAPSGGTVYAVSGGAGSYSAQPTSPSALWQVGTGSGEFTYSYPFELPPATVGVAPSLAVSYSSASVDGMTMAENGQASAAGMGWSDPSPGYITRSYASCDKDGQSGKGDFCWKTRSGNLINEYTLIFNGQAAPLVRIGSTDTFRLRDDEGWRVELFQSTSPDAGEPSNADNDNEGFKVTLPNGTVYWFGMGRGSGSVWTVPVYGNDPGEPCYKATTSDAFCQQAWRWNLDRVVDPSGNKINYFYSSETNYYARWANTSAAYRTAYDRAGALTRVEYGIDRTVGAARQVVYLTQSKRCTENMGPTLGDCTGSNSPSNAPNKWPDVPVDLICSDSGTCLNGSPAFFTLNMYTGVSAQTQMDSPFVGAALVVKDVDEWELRYAMPDPDGESDPDTPDLWLNSIIRTGHIQGGSLSLPKVMFDGTALQNRVAPGGGRKFLKFRLNSIRTETGGRIDVVYGHASLAQTCDSGYVSGRARWNTTRECWASRWTPPSGGEPQWEWFHKYVVTQIGLSDDAMGYRLGQSASQATKLASLRVYDYDYEGSAFWRFTNSKNTESEDETWADWRGYGSTRIHTRNIAGQAVAPGDSSQTRTVRFRGMYNTPKNLSDDRWSDDETKLSTAQMSAAQEPTDYQWLAGRTAEAATLNFNGDLISRTYTDWGWFATAHENNRDARIRYPTYTDTVTWVDDETAAGTLQHHQVNYTVNEGNADTHLGLYAGVVTRVHDEGAPAIATDDRCTITTWTGNSTAWIRVPDRTSTYEGSCAQADAGTANLVSETKSTYDSSGTSPQSQGTITRGLPTENSTKASVNSGGTGSWLNTRTSYDSYGRPVNQWDANGNKTDTAYNPGSNSADILTELVVTDPKGYTTTTTLEPRTGLPVKVKDANNAVTTTDYDALGRLTSVSLPGAPSGVSSISYDYQLSASAPSMVHAAILRSGSTTFNHSYAYFDGWGRQIESQAPQPETPTKRYVTATGYDNLGQAYLVMPAVPNGSAPGIGLLNPAPSDVVRYSITDFDGASRPTETKTKSYNSVLWSDKTDYLGDRTVTTPPVGGTTVTYFDRFGQTSSIELHAGGPHTNVRDSTNYTYTGVGQLATIKKQLDGSSYTYAWKYGYDLAGRKVYTSDPDIGATLTSYDDNSNPTVVTSAKDLVLGGYPWQATATGVVSRLSTTYDSLNRPLVVRNDLTSPTTELTRYTYDDATRGKGRLASTKRRLVVNGTVGDYTSSVEEYDARGNVLATSDSYPTWLTGETATSGTTVKKTTQYGYNEADQLTSTTFPSGEGFIGSMNVTSAYGVNGVLKLVTDSSSNRTLANLTYDNIGKPITIDSTGDGTNADLKRSYTWQDTTGRLSSITGTIKPSGASAYTGLALTYTYDAVGNPTRITGTQQSGADTYNGAWCYTYDPLQRLSTARTGLPDSSNGCAADNGNIGSGNGTDGTGSRSITGRAYNLSYTYDTSGDRIASVTTVGYTPIANYGYINGSNAHPHQMRSISAGAGVGTTPGVPTPVTATYDDLGRISNLTASAGAPSGIGITTYTYDAESNLLTTTAGTGNDRPSSANQYAPGGTRLVRSTYTTTNGVTTETRTIYRSDGTELTLVLTNGTVTTNARATRPVSILSGLPVATKNNTGWTWLLGDQQHNVRLTRSTTNLVQRHTYTPYGEPSFTPAAPGARGYLNQPHDLTGDVRLDHRNYTPTLGVLTTPDPILITTDPQNLNPYAYARNNPITGSDPTGLMNDSGALGDSSHHGDAPVPIAPSSDPSTAYWYEQNLADEPDYGNIVSDTGALIGHIASGAKDALGGAISSSAHIAEMAACPACGMPGGFSPADALDNSMQSSGFANTDSPMFHVGEVLAPIPGGAAIKGVKGAREGYRLVDEALHFRSAAADAVESVAAKTGTVWDDLVGTAGAIPGTGGLPKSFELTAGNSRVWVHGNVTDHLADAARSAARSGQSPEMVGLGTQQRLRSLQAAVGSATRGGVPLNQRMTVGGWELEFRQRAGDALPALIHGRWVG